MYKELTMRRTKEEAAITREQLLKKALTAFSKKGYAATTLEDIAREAEVTRGAIYWHFGSKAELYNTLVREYSDRGNVIMQQAVSEGGTLLDILRRVLVRQLETIEDDREMRALMELYLFKTGLVPELEEGRQQQIEFRHRVDRNVSRHHGARHGARLAALRCGTKRNGAYIPCLPERSYQSVVDCAQSIFPES